MTTRSSRTLRRRRSCILQGMSTESENAHHAYTISKTLGGVPAELVYRYLESLPDAATESGVVTGPGWRAEIVAEEPRHHPGVSIRQVRLTLSGSQDRVDAVLEYLMPRVMRGGA